MLGVTSVNRCRACDRVHRRLGRVVGVRFDGPEGLRAAETAAYTYGQAMAARGPCFAHPTASAGGMAESWKRPPSRWSWPISRAIASFRSLPTSRRSGGGRRWKPSSTTSSCGSPTAQGSGQRETASVAVRRASYPRSAGVCRHRASGCCRPIPVRHAAVHEVATRASPPGCRSRSRGARCSSTVVGLVFAPAIENGLLTVTRPSPYDGWGFNRPTG